VTYLIVVCNNYDATDVAKDLLWTELDKKYEGKLLRSRCSAKTGVGISDLKLVLSEVSNYIAKPVLDIINGAIKLLIIGNSNIGKTTFLQCAQNGSAPVNVASTINADLFNIGVVVYQKCYAVTCWDTAGQEKYSSLTNTFYQNTHIILFAYDTSISAEQEAKENVRWKEKVLECRSYKYHQIIQRIGLKSDIGNKSDKERCFTKNNPQAIQDFVVKCVQDFIINNKMAV
jgi:small GTP-binding protein